MVIFDTEPIDFSKPVYQKIKNGKYHNVKLYENTAIVGRYENENSYYDDIWCATGCTYPIFTSYCLSRAKDYFKDVDFFTNLER